jgi:predicted GNAT family acetyltransferase
LLINGPNSGQQAFETLTQKLLSDGVFPPGVMGPAPVSKTFASIWTRTTRTRYQTGMRLRIHELREVTPLPHPVSGQIRLATDDDVDLVTRWAVAFQAEALPESDPGQTREAIIQRIKEQEIYLWDDNRPVSIAAKARPISNGIMVNFVYTPPEFRRRGYASACVAALSQILLDSGWQFCALYTDLSNPTSNHIYQTIGYQPICDSNEYIFDVKNRKPG